MGHNFRLGEGLHLAYIPTAVKPRLFWKVQTYFLRDPAASQHGTWTSETSDCLGNLSRAGYYCFPLNANSNRYRLGI